MALIRDLLHYWFPRIFRSSEQIIEEKRIMEEIKQKEIQRKNTPCIFSEDLTKNEFEQIALEISEPIKRLTIKVDNQFITGVVRTQSGIDTWKFILDFNDFGVVTGKYWWIDKGNPDSKIPEAYAMQLQETIVLYIKNKQEHTNL